MTDNATIVAELARVKAIFQQRTLVAILTQETPAPTSESPVRVGGAEKNTRAAAVTSGLGDNGNIRQGCESTGTTHISNCGFFNSFFHEG